MEQESKLSQPDYEQAEQEILSEHQKEVERRLGNESLSTYNDPSHEDEAQLADFMDEEDYSTDSSGEEYESPISAREEKAKDIMSRLIKQNVIDSGRQYYRLKKSLSTEELILRMAIGNHGISSRNRITDSIRDKIDDIKSDQEKLAEESPESYVITHGIDFRNHVKEIHDGKIVTTPYVQEHLDRLEENMAEGQPTFIHGHLGSGKTELAIMAAKETSIKDLAYHDALREVKDFVRDNPESTKEERRNVLSRSYRRNVELSEAALAKGDKKAVELFSPLVISGSKDLTSQDMYTDKTLQLSKFNGKSLLEHKEDLDKEIEKWKKEHPEEASDPEKSRNAANEILELYKLKNQAFGTEVKTIKQAIYRGVEEGRPVIIDEVNAIPSAVLISLNDVLQKRPGDTCNIPGAAEPIRIKEGFSITMTGNLTSNLVNYGGTEELNPAFLSRLDVFEHDYLPMSENDRNPHEQMNPKDNELFQVAVSYLAERTGDLQLPEMDKSLNKLFAMCQLAHQTQTIFEGKWRESDSIKNGSGDIIEPRLEKSVLSVRNLVNVLKEWDKGSEKDLDKALWDSFISGITNADDQNLVLTLAKMHGFFSESDGWQVKAKEVGAGLTSLSEIHPGDFAHQRKPLETLSLRGVVDTLYGPRPERDKWPEDLNLDELEDTFDEEPTMDDFVEAQNKINEANDIIDAFEVLSEQCGCNVNEAEMDGENELW